jgi:hypothetical protein
MSHEVILVLCLCPGVHAGGGLGSKEGRCGKLKSFAFCHAVAQALFDSKKVLWCNFLSLLLYQEVINVRTSFHSGRQESTGDERVPPSKPKRPWRRGRGHLLAKAFTLFPHSSRYHLHTFAPSHLSHSASPDVIVLKFPMIRDSASHLTLLYKGSRNLGLTTDVTLDSPSFTLRLSGLRRMPDIHSLLFNVSAQAGIFFHPSFHK